MNPIIPLYKQADRLIVRSKDCYVYDSDNREYIDFESGDWAANLGHSNSHINSVIKTQIDKLIHDGLRFRSNESELLAIKLLDKLSLNNGQCVFLNSGSEAVNLGITIAKKLTGRKKILKIDSSYLSAYGHGQISDDNSELINIPFDNFEAISDIDINEVAVFVFEPGNSFGLIKYPNVEFVKIVASEVKRFGGLLMANEVTAGFGRTGKWFGFEHYEFHPDIVSVGKALGNGYPISGVAISSMVAELFPKFQFRYAQSHQNDALGCAIGIEVIETIDRDDLITESFKKGEYFKQRLAQLQAKHQNIITDIRARGLMLAMDLSTSENADILYNQLIERCILVGFKERTIRFMPPLTIKYEDIDNLTDAISEIITCMD